MGKNTRKDIRICLYKDACLSLSFSLSFFLRSRGRRGCREMNARRTETTPRSPMTPNRSSSLRDIRFRARIPNSRGDRIEQRKNKSIDPKDIRVRARISNTRSDRVRQHKNKSFHSKDTRFRANISNTRGDHSWQHTYKYLHPKDFHFRARISNTRGDR